MELYVIGAAIILLIVANYLYQRQKERDLVNRLKPFDDNPKAALSELDTEIEQDHERAEFWKKQSGRQL